MRTQAGTAGNILIASSICLSICLSVPLSLIVCNINIIIITLYSEEAEPALMGVNRVWVCHAHRRKGIATKLLDAAR